MEGKCIMKIKREALVGEYITEALLILMKKEAYREISITEICAKAGVTRMSFYRNFESKEDVLRRWIAGVTERFLAASEISYKEDTAEEYFTKLFTHLERYKGICDALYRADLIYLVKEQFDRVLVELHHEDYDDYKSYFLSGGIYNVFLLWLINGAKERPQELAKRLDRLLVK